MQCCGYYRPQAKLYIMVTSVCQEFCPQGGSVHTPSGRQPPWADTSSPLGRQPPVQTPPWSDTPSQIPPLFADTSPWVDTPLGRHPPSRRLLQWTVLECILVVNGFLLPMSMIGPFNCRSRPTKSLNEQQEGISVECQLPTHQQQSAFHSEQV